MKKREDKNRYIDPKAACPLYRYQGFHTICCEGAGCAVTLVYPNFMQRTEHLRKFCEKDYEACGVYGAAQTGIL